MLANIPVPPFTMDKLQPSTRWMVAHGRTLRNRDTPTRQRAMEATLDKWLSADDPDAWLMPTCAVLPPKVGDFEGLDGEAMFRAVVPIGALTAAFNVTGQPAITLPAGRSRLGLPIGVQLVMRRGADRDLIALASTLEASLRGLAEDSRVSVGGEHALRSRCRPSICRS